MKKTILLLFAVISVMGIFSQGNLLMPVADSRPAETLSADTNDIETSDPQPIVFFNADIHYSCVDTLFLVNRCSGYDYYSWDFGDGRTSSYRDPLPIVYTYTGTYVVTLTAGRFSDGSEDSFSVTVAVNGIFDGVTEDSTCCRTPFIYNGKAYETPGTYIDTTLTQDSCLILHKLILHHKTAHYTLPDRNLCTGDTIMFGNRLITEEGIYYDTIISKTGCDSILTMRAFRNPQIKEFNYRFCTGQSVTIKGPSGKQIVISEGGIYYDTLLTQHGCDSIIKYVVNFDPSYFFMDSAKICPGESYTFRGKTYNKPGTYYDRLTCVNTGCDSIYCLKLTYRSNFYEYIDTTYVTRLNGFYTWRGRNLYNSGTYVDSFLDINGCDSIYKLRLVIDKPWETYLRDTICEGTKYYFGGKYYNKTGLYVDTLKSMTLSDSVLKLYLQVHPRYNFYDTVKTCDDSYTYHGITYVYSGYYTHTYKTVHGCDSNYHLFLQLYRNNRYVTHATLDCYQQYYDWRGDRYYKTGQYVEHHTNRNGCDSDYVLILEWAVTYREINICEGDSFMLGSRVLTQQGIYYDSLKCKYGQDSVIQITLNVIKPHHYYDTVRICDGSYYNFRGRMISAAGNYYDSLRTDRGCDSIYHLNLQIAPKFHEIDSMMVCTAGHFRWREKSIIQSGTYFDSLKTDAGCDSIYELRVTFRPPKYTTLNESMCEGDVYSFLGHDYTMSGEYYDTLRTSDGCDSIIKLVLNVHPKYLITQRAIICQGESYLYRGKSYTQAGTYHDTLKSVSGCDSIYELELVIAYPFREVTFDTICSNVTYHWRNRTLNESGVYYDSLNSATGCDSVYELHLFKHDTYLTTVRQDICQGSTFVFGSRVCSQSGFYYDTLKSIYGCDSIVKLVLNVTSGYKNTIRKTICQGGYYNFRGRKLHLSGYYADSLRMTNGCDSIYEIYLTVAQPFLDVRYDTAYANIPYRWHGRTLTHTGTYYDSLVSKTGCDSVFVLHLIYNTSHLIETTVRLCPGESYFFRGRYLNVPGVYDDSLTTPQGNDSIYRLYLYPTWDYHISDSVHLCQGSTYNFRGKTIVSPGTYFDSLRTSEGCDSIYQLVVTVDTSYFFSEYDSRCSSETYLWHNRNITKSGIYYDSLKSSTGCDSVYRLELYLYSPYFQERSVTLCKGQSYPFAGMHLTRSGIYYDTLTTSHGCDSVIKLVLKVTPHYEFYDTATICQGDYYPFFGQRLRASGDYTKRLKTVVANCDSIYHLHLTVNPSYHFLELDTVCKNSPYLWRGRYLTHTGFYYDSLQTSLGCDSVYELRLVFNDIHLIERNISLCEGESYYFGGKNYSAPGIYYDTLLSTHGCDSIVKLVVTVNLPHHFYDTADICQGNYYNFRGRRLYNPGTYYDSLRTRKTGCDSIYQLFLRVRPSYHFVDWDTLCTDVPYIWRGKELTEKGVYYDSLVTVQGCDSIYELRLELNHIYHFTRHITLCPGEAYHYRDKDLSEPGTYIDSLASSFGCDSIITIIITRDYKHDRYDTARICRGDFYPFYGRRLTTAGDYTEVFKTVTNACDSIHHLHLIVDPIHFTTDYDTICSNGRYLWHGNYYGKSGVYYDTLPSSLGCDSIFELRLTVFPVPTAERYIEICQGGHMTYRGKNYSAQGVYYDTIRTVHGCDSILKITVSILPNYFVSDTVMMCNGGTYNFRGKICTAPGVYRDTLHTVKCGCDSIFEVVIHGVSTYHYIEYDTVCSNNTYFWRNRYFTTSGTYFDSLHSVLGCDSVYELRLVVNPIPVVERYHEICEGHSFFYRGRNISAQGVYYDTILTVHGCDSILKLTLIVTPNYFTSDTVYVCSGTSYNFRGRTVSFPGVYRDTVPTRSTGCDSIFEVVILPLRTYHFIEYDTVCSNNTYLWRNRYFTATGTYFDSLRSSNGCDSVYELRLVVYPIPVVERYHEICRGQSFFYRGRNISAQGVYYDTLRTIHGCDSILKLTLVVTPDYLSSDTVTICSGTSYNFRGRTVSHPGTYRDTLTTAVSGCDSIIELVLRTIPNYYFIEYDTLCTDGTYLWHGHYLTSSGTYYDSLTAINGCDSVYELRLQLNRPSHLVRYISLCHGNSFSFRGRTISTQGIYYDTLRTTQGCDSVIQYVVSVTPTYLFSDTAYICTGNTYSFRGRALTNPGTYRDTLVTAGCGCDSIYEIILRTSPTYHYVEYDTLCSNFPYYWRGRQFTQSGIYYDSLQSISGCDSVYELRLTLHHSVVTEIHKDICQGQFFSFFGRDYSTQGIYYDTLQTIHGCDSVIKLMLNVMPHYLLSDTVTICRGSSYSFRGISCSKSGTYRDTLQTVHGCDSIFELILRILPTYHFIEYDTICTSGTYLWHGQYLTSSGTYYDSLSAVNGCDSVYELRLQMNRPSHLVRYISICHGKSFNLRGRTISTQGTYYDTLRTTQGCDSIIEYVVSVTPTYLFSDTAYICTGGSYNFRGRTLSNPGTYRDTLSTAINGCDSIYELVLRTLPTYYFIEYDTVCSNTTYLWHGQYLTSSGTYYDSLHAINGCDSIYELRLQLNRPSHLVRYISLCHGKSFTIRGRTISAQGTYYDTLRTTQGCDSVVEYVVSVTPTYLFSDTAYICTGNAYSFRGRTLSNPGTYRDTLSTAINGCDSIYELVLRTSPTYHFIEYDTVCSNTPYYWHGRHFTQSGIYFDSLQSISGCDSVYELRLTLYHSVVTEIHKDICEGQFFSFFGRNYSAQGIYYDTLQTIHGCDSVIKLVLNVMPVYLQSDSVTICSGSSYIFRGIICSKPGIYCDTLRTIQGCDSIFELLLRTLPTYYFIEYDTVCTSSTHIWHGQYLTSSGTYYDSLHAINGCDSIYELRLQLNRPSHLVRYISLCHGKSFTIRGRTISAQGIYYDTLRTTQGCDSVIQYVVSVTPTYLFSDTAYICMGNAYSFRGRSLTNPGVYRDTLSTAGCGCDSIYELVLRTSPTYHFVEYDTVCSNTPYYWHGRHLTQSGVYFDSLQSISGCDSVYELRLTLYHSVVTEIHRNLCEGQFFSFFGRNYSAQGIYYDTLQTIHGCDSVIKLVLNVMPVYLQSDTVTICSGSSYIFRGIICSKPGIYRDTLQTMQGCDSIFELVLRTLPTYYFIEHDTVCTNTTYLWHGQYLTASGTYYDSLHAVNGCDSIYELRLQYNRSYTYVRNVQICQGQSFFIRGRDISEQGIYYDTLQTAQGCDSIIKYVVIVSPDFEMVDSAVICSGETYNFRGRLLSFTGIYRDTVPTVGPGCDSIFVLHLTVNPTYHYIEYDTLCSSDVYLWRGRHLTQSGTYYDSLQTVDLCDSIYELRLFLYPDYLTEYHVSLCDGQSYQFHGRTISSQGIYYDTLQSIHGCDSIVRMVLTIHPHYMQFDTVTICRGEAYDFHGRSVRNAGVYYDTLRTAGGCDSIFQLYVKVSPTFHDIFYDTLCTNGTYLWRNHYYSVTGVYYDSLKSSLGCDSVYELRLTVFNHKVTIIHEEICHGTNFFFNGRQLSQPGTYRDTLTRSSGGCDSIVELVLSVAATYLYETDVTICQGDYYDFRGRHVTQQGTYFDTLHTVISGCDSIYKLNLTVHRTNRTITNVQLCAGDYYVFNDSTIYTSGTYIDTFRTVDGCDSILELHISFSDPTLTVIHKTICKNQVFTNTTGHTFNQTGVHYDTLVNHSGCDSIFRIILNVVDNITVYDTAYFVKGTTYYYRNRQYTSAGDYYDTAYSTVTCDTFYYLHLEYAPNMVIYLDTTFCANHPVHYRGRVYYTAMTDTFNLPDPTKVHTDTLLIFTTHVLPHSVVYLNDSTCDGNPYFFGGQWRTVSGQYADTLYKMNGCDSIINLNLKIFPREDNEENVTICETESYSWHGRTLTQAGTYFDTLRNAQSGCNIYCTLNLTVVYETKLLVANLNDTAQMCQDDRYYDIAPTFLGAVPTRYSITYDNTIVPASNNIDTTYDNNIITIPIPKDSRGLPMRPDIYTVTLSLGNGYCDATPYNATFDLLIKYPNSVLNQHFNDVVSVFNSANNGGYDFTQFKWYVNGVQVLGANESNLYLTTLTQGDQVYAELRRAGENYFIPTCYLVIDDMGPEPQPYPVSLEASYFLPGKAYARLKSSESGDYRVYDMKGSLVGTGEVISDAETEVSLPYIAGCYLIVVRTETAYQTFKIVVR